MNVIRGVLILLMLVPTISAVGQTRVHDGTGCAGAVPQPGVPALPSGAQLAAWTRAYYPDLVANAEAPARLVVGFVIDERCRVLRHSVGMLPHEYDEDIVLRLFPGVERRRMPAGVADAAPLAEEGATLRDRSRLVAAWLMQVRPEWIARERLRLRRPAR